MSGIARGWVFRTLIVVGCFVFSGIGTALVIGAKLPFPPVPDISARFRYFAQRKDECDTVFIGSSRIRHQIIPQQFDAATADGGVATHSFNLGYSGMWPPESFYFLRQVLALHPRKLRWVVIELMDYRFSEVDQQRPTMRTMYWHDWRQTGMALRVVMEATLPPAEKCRLMLLHTWLFAQRLSNPGRGAEWLRERYFPAKGKVNTDWMKRAGFDPAVDPAPWSEAARADLARQVEAVKESLPPQTARPGFVVALHDLLEDLQRARVEPIFVITPTVHPAENLVRGLPDGLTVFPFNQPTEYPQLYVPEMHYNVGHLNEQGAQEFTRLVAEKFVAHVGRR